MKVYSGKVRSGKQKMLNGELDILIKKQKKLLSSMDKDIRSLKRQIRFEEYLAFSRVLPSMFRVDALRSLAIANLALEKLLDRYNAENLKLEILMKEKECGPIKPLLANVPINKDK